MTVHQILIYLVLILLVIRTHRVMQRLQLLYRMLEQSVVFHLMVHLILIYLVLTLLVIRIHLGLLLVYLVLLVLL